jgi:hypothetical protein
MPSNTDDLPGGVRGTESTDPANLDPVGWVERRLELVSGNLRAWGAFTIYAVVICVLHFEYGLNARWYWEVWWWDLLTHAASGFGVAAIAPLIGLWRGRPVRERVLLTAGALLVVGAGFEVYERLFRTFWYEWTFATYAEDTAVDIFVDVLGGVAFVLVQAGWASIRPSE